MAPRRSVVAFFPIGLAVMAPEWLSAGSCTAALGAVSVGGWHSGAMSALYLVMILNCVVSIEPLTQSEADLGECRCCLRQFRCLRVQTRGSTAVQTQKRGFETDSAHRLSLFLTF